MEIQEVLRNMVDNGKLPHAIMLEESDGGGAMALTMSFLQYLYCKNRQGHQPCGQCPSCNKVAKLIHPDIHFIFPVNTSLSADYMAQWRELVLTNPKFTENDLSEQLEIEGKSALIKVDESKALLQALSFSSLERGYKTVVVYLPEKMNKEAANRLLKIVEEPPAQTLFIFITHSPEQVLVTISSRCQHFSLFSGPGRGDAMALSAEMDLFRSLMQGLLAKDLYACLEIADNIAALPSREKAKNFCNLAAENMRYVFLLQQGMDSLVQLDSDRLAECRDWAKRSRKAFPRHALEAFSRAKVLIGRNVNLKILFTDLVNGLYRNI